ncbi:MAG: prolipoprotein diacylglyceryl transferase [Chloroflexia bacterium]|nr:prolipoprotein diacylglyceryl transferase [Chloroflexia bacterium]
MSEAKSRRISIGTVIFALLALALFGYMLSQAIPNWRGEANPVAFRLGSLRVPWYGIMLMSGAMVGALLGEWEARRRGLNSDHIWSILLWGLILGVGISRLWYILGNPEYYFQQPLRIIGVENGTFVGLRGLTIHGALFGAVLAVILYTWRQKLHFWLWLDVGVIGFVIGQAVGRWGNFFNQEAYGWRTGLPWGLRIAPEFRIDALSYLGNVLPEYTKLGLGEPVCDRIGLACYRNLSYYPFESTRFHPTFLYESLWNVAVCLFLIFLARRFGQRIVRGELFFIYGVLYAVGRFAVEALRVDSLYLGRYPAGQVVSLGLLLVCLLFIVARRWIWNKPVGPVGEEPAVQSAAGE